MNNAPQIIYFILIVIGLLLAANQHGKAKDGKHNFWSTLISYLLGFALFYWGGFFDNIF